MNLNFLTGTICFAPTPHSYNDGRHQREKKEDEREVDSSGIISQIGRSPTRHFLPPPSRLNATNEERGSHTDQHVEHGRYASALPRSPTSEHTAHRHLRVALNSETHVSDDVTQRVAPGKDGEAEDDGRDVEHEPDGVEKRDELVGDGGDPEHGENEAGENEDLRWREGGDRTTR